MTQEEAIIKAFNEMGGERRPKEIEAWVKRHLPEHNWKDFGTTMADMINPDYRGSPNTRGRRLVLVRTRIGVYRLLTSSELNDAEKKKQKNTLHSTNL